MKHNKTRKKFKKNVLENLFNRSQGLCEVCGTSITLDNHHILEHHLERLDTDSNLIQVCQNCHRQIPKYLSREQQNFLQTDINELSNTANHKFFLQSKSVVIGSNTFIETPNILQINGSNVFYLSEQEIRKDTKVLNSKYLLHAVMLDNFDPQLLILGNRIIYGQDLSLESKAQSLKLFKNQIEIFSMEVLNEKLYINCNFKYKNKIFSFTRKMTTFPGLILSNATIQNFPCAIAWNG